MIDGIYSMQSCVIIIIGITYYDQCPPNAPHNLMASRPLHLNEWIAWPGGDVMTYNQALKICRANNCTLVHSDTNKRVYCLILGKYSCPLYYKTIKEAVDRAIAYHTATI